MADFVLQKPKAFTFAMEEGGREYTLPPMARLTYEDIDIFAKIRDGGRNPGEQMILTKDFLLKYCPDLEKEDLGDVAYVQIFRAYSEHQNNNGGKPGEK